jgi:hypothetical protein
MRGQAAARHGMSVQVERLYNLMLFTSPKEIYTNMAAVAVKDKYPVSIINRLRFWQKDLF